MPNDLLLLDLADTQPMTRPSRPTSETLVLRPVELVDHDDLALLYGASYPPDIGAADADAARAEITATFAGQFGELLPAASLIAHVGAVPAGAILTTTHSIWDDDLDGPFVIDFFVAPDFRSRGIGCALLLHAIDRCRDLGQSTLAMRVGQGTSAEAHALYRRIGFRPRNRAVRDRPPGDRG